MAKPNNISFPDGSDIIGVLKGSRAFKDAAAEHSAALIQQRQGMVDQLAKLEADAEVEFPKLTADIEKAVAAAKKAEEALKVAKQKVAAAAAKRTSASQVAASTKLELETALAASASPLIDAFIAEMRDDEYQTRKSISGFSQTETNQVTGVTRHRVYSNAESLQARIAAINAAIETANQLKFKPDQAGVEETLNALRKSLPAVGAPK